jgi:hypothetical protein
VSAEALALVAFVIAVLAGAGVLFIGTAAGYVLWRYAYSPFVVLRRDVGALKARQDDLERQINEALESMRRRVASFSNEELASVERRMRMESTRRAAHSE